MNVSTISHHHPSQKSRILHTLATRVVIISYNEHLEEELGNLPKALQNNGYNKKIHSESIQNRKI